MDCLNNPIIENQVYTYIDYCLAFDQIYVSMVLTVFERYAEYILSIISNNKI